MTYSYYLILIGFCLSVIAEPATLQIVFFNLVVDILDDDILLFKELCVVKRLILAGKDWLEICSHIVASVSVISRIEGSRGKLPYFIDQQSVFSIEILIVWRIHLSARNVKIDYVRSALAVELEDDLDVSLNVSVQRQSIRLIVIVSATAYSVCGKLVGYVNAVVFKRIHHPRITTRFRVRKRQCSSVIINLFSFYRDIRCGIERCGKGVSVIKHQRICKLINIALISKLINSVKSDDIRIVGICGKVKH